jgi:hypothetical protein
MSGFIVSEIKNTERTKRDLFIDFHNFIGCLPLGIDQKKSVDNARNKRVEIIVSDNEEEATLIIKDLNISIDYYLYRRPFGFKTIKVDDIVYNFDKIHEIDTMIIKKIVDSLLYWAASASDGKPYILPIHIFDMATRIYQACIFIDFARPLDEINL